MAKPSKESFEQWADQTLAAADMADLMAADAGDGAARAEWQETAELLRAKVRDLRRLSATGSDTEWS